MTSPDTAAIRQRLHENALIKSKEAWGRLDGGQDLSIGAQLATDAADAIESLDARIATLEADNVRMREALVDHNELLRSAHAIALREFGEPETTNWLAYLNRVKAVLEKHHQTTNEARAALDALALKGDGK